MAEPIQLVLTAAASEPVSGSSPRLHPIVVMRAGASTVIHPVSKLPVYFPWEVIARDGPSVFEGVQAKAGHNAGDADDPSGVNGVVKDVFGDSDTQELRATYICLDDNVQKKVTAAKSEGVLGNLFEFSMKTPAETHRGTIDGKQYEIADRLIKFVHTRVDTVTKGAAGGRFVLAAASSSGDHSTMNWKTFKAEQPELAAKLLGYKSAKTAVKKISDIEDLEVDGSFYGDFAVDYVDTSMAKATEEATEEETTEAVSETVTDTVATVTDEVNLKPALEAADRAEQALAEMVKLQTRNHAVVSLEKSGLDDKDQEYIRTAVLEASTLDEVDSLITKHQEFVKKSQDVPSMITGDPRDAHLLEASITAGDDAFVVYRKRIEGLFAGESVRLEEGSKVIVPRFRNYKEMAENHPSQPRVYNTAPELFASANDWFKGTSSGAQVRRGPDRHIALLEAAIGTSTHTEIFADVMHKLILGAYTSNNDVESIRAMASQRLEVDDFKDHKFISLAEYTEPPALSEGDTYEPLTTPADLQEKQKVGKHGFIETRTMESLIDPDGQVFILLPQRMGHAMKSKEMRIYLDAITTDNTAMDHDSVTLYHSDHNNQNTNALSITNLALATVAMKKQVARGSLRRFGTRNRPEFIMVPIELEDLVDRIINPTGFELAISAPGASTEINKGQFTGLKKIVLDQQTNAKDWFLMAKPNSAGALDGADTFAVLRLRGVTEPEFFTQDSEDSESMFGSDKINWKLRHFFGVKTLDERSFYFNNVA